jgi:3-oxoacyl-[acyl-carrier protein] reductase
MALEKRTFDGQVGVVTGGARGLGLGIVTRLASQGLKTVIFDVDEELARQQCSDLEKKGYEVDFIKVDVSIEDSVTQGFHSVATKYGRLDVMVNSAGITGPTDGLVCDTSVEDFDKVYAVNVRGSFLTTKYALKEMLKQNYGRILLVASVSGKDGNVGASAYSASKAAVIGLAKSVGKEYAGTGITVNSLAPATVYTPLVAKSDPAYVQRQVDKIPMKRMGTVKEIAAMVSFIVSPEASFSTAGCFDVSGGRSTY